MNHREVDYSVYLVTDSSLVPEDRTFLGQIKAAIDNGAGIVQLREKNLSTQDFVERARQVHELTQARRIPLIINDRVDVALAVDAEGVHVGQDDMDVETVRRLIGPDKILGLSISSMEEARGAIHYRDLLDYVGIGSVFSTNTKKLAKKPIGFSGVRDILKVLYEEGGNDLKTVAIGGINEKNSTALFRAANTPGKSLDGIAVVSVIMASANTDNITNELLQMVKSDPWIDPFEVNSQSFDIQSKMICNVASFSPLTHQITNGVVKNFSANVTLSVGGSPIMSESVGDFEALAKVPKSALLVNAGTVGPESLDIYASAITAYNYERKPVVFDPVGVGASDFRKDFSKRILDSGYVTVIKGNAAEILTLAGAENVEMKGVDSGSFEPKYLQEYASKLALETRSIVVITGRKDIIADGIFFGERQVSNNVQPSVFTIDGGHPLMGKITGSGCSLGSVIATFVGANPQTPLSAVVTAVRLYKYAGGIAGKLNESKGPGSFLSSFIDELYKAFSENKPDTWNVECDSI